MDVMDKLLSPEGCPWDKEQTAQSLAPYVIEEAHELAQALDQNDLPNIREELGDVLFQVIFHSALGSRNGTFTFEEVVENVCTKLIRRHPHVFGDKTVSGSDEVLKNWEEIKKQEKQGKQKTFDIPQGMPALQRAHKIGSKTKKLKFDWEKPEEVLAKVEEEFDEFREAFRSKNAQATEEELGDLLFSLAQMARHLNLDAETVGRKANTKFEDRFEKMLQIAKDENQDFDALTLDEKEALWEKAKGSTKV